MGNCLFGPPDDDDHLIKVITSTGGIMEFYAPVTVELITDEFPGHGIFRSHDLFWKPIPHNEFLVAGNSYYLLPLNDGGARGINVGHVRSNSLPTVVPLNLSAPYRMSFDNESPGPAMFKFKKKRSYSYSYASDGYSRSSKSSRSSSSSSRMTNKSSGFWKVKLVISPEQLLEILSQEGRTQELIENVRTVAKCGNEAAVVSCNSSSSAALSDQWSLCSSSRNASSKKDVVALEDM